MYVAAYLEFLLQKLHLLYTDVHNAILYGSVKLFMWNSFFFALNIKPSNICMILNF